MENMIIMEAFFNALRLMEIQSNIDVNPVELEQKQIGSVSTTENSIIND